MKKLAYLFVFGALFALTACGGGEATTEEAVPAVNEEAVEAVNEEVAVEDTTAADHDHSDGESHDHDHSDGESHDHSHGEDHNH